MQQTNFLSDRGVSMDDELRRDDIVGFFTDALESPDNNTGDPADGPALGDFLLGVVAGDDKIFDTFKEAVGPHFDPPAQLFNKAFLGADVKPEELSILAWVLPQRESVRKANREQTALPSMLWERARVGGEIFYNKMGMALEKFFAERNIQAFFPMGHPDIVKRFQSEKFYLTTNWSERHACHAAGLGTFGLCDGLITPAGKAHRCGSIIVHTKLTPTPRAYSGVHDYCLRYTKGTCGACIKRCPSGALSENGHNKKICEEFLLGACAEYFKGFSTYTCGLCQTKVPCEDRIPGRKIITPVRGFI